MHDDEWNDSSDERDPWTAQFGARPDGLITPAVYRPAAEDDTSSLDTGGAGMQQVLNFYFPVYIEAVGALGDGQIDRIAGYIFDALDDALRAQA